MLRLSQWVGKPVKNGTGIGPATVHFSNVVKGRMFHARKTGYKYILAYPTLFENYVAFEFFNFALSTNFCNIKSDLSGNTVWPKHHGFQKLAKLPTQNVNVKCKCKHSLAMLNATFSVIFKHCELFYQHFWGSTLQVLKAWTVFLGNLQTGGKNVGPQTFNSLPKYCIELKQV